MRKAAREMGFSDNWKAALAKVKSSFVPPGGQDDLVAQQARETIRFVKEHDLITVPPLCEETWRLTMTSPERQKTMPYAAYGGQEMTVAYASESMKHDDKLMAMRGNNRHFSRIVTAHELIPGHHLERYQSSRHRSYRGLFSTPFFVEGWGLYWELRLWDLKYAKSSRRPDRHALLADEPLGPDHRLVPVPPGNHEARGDGRFPGRPGREREVGSHQRGAQVSSVSSPLPGGIHAGRSSALRPASRGGRGRAA